MTASKKTRASGMTAGQEAAKEVAKDEDKSIEVMDDAERRRRWRSPGLARMRFDWRRDDGMVVSAASQMIDDRMISEFSDAYAALYEIYEAVRTPMVDANGERVIGRDGFPEWVRLPSGAFDEDFSKLTHAEREHFMFQITTHLFDWECRQADAWANAMFAKVVFEEHFSIEYDLPVSGTIEDREARGKINAAEDRYYAIVATWYSRRVDALVRSLERLALRIKDSLTLG